MTAPARIDRPRMTAAQIVAIVVERYGRERAETYLRRRLAHAGQANYARKYARAIEILTAMEG